MLKTPLKVFFGYKEVHYLKGDEGLFVAGKTSGGAIFTIKKPASLPAFISNELTWLQYYAPYFSTMARLPFLTIRG